MESGNRLHITKTPGICGGRPCIAGHRMRVQDIVVLHEMRGMSTKAILAEYPGISLADVYAALVYYFDNPAEIDAGFRKADEWAEWAKMHCPSQIPANLREKLGG